MDFHTRTAESTSSPRRGRLPRAAAQRRTRSWPSSGPCRGRRAEPRVRAAACGGDACPGRRSRPARTAVVPGPGPGSPPVSAGGGPPESAPSTRARTSAQSGFPSRTMRATMVGRMTGSELIVHSRASEPLMVSTALELCSASAIAKLSFSSDSVVGSRRIETGVPQSKCSRSPLTRGTSPGSCCGGSAPSSSSGTSQAKASANTVRLGHLAEITVALQVGADWAAAQPAGGVDVEMLCLWRSNRRWRPQRSSATLPAAT